VSSLPHRLLLVPALLAVLWAQAFGMHLGYHCDCDQAPNGGHFTLIDHCHGPQNAATGDHHHDWDHFDSSHSHDSSPSEEPLHEHEAVVDTLVAHPLSLTKVQPPPPSFFPASLPPVRFVSALLLTPQPPRLIASPSLWRRCPQVDDWPRQLSQSIALRL